MITVHLIFILILILIYTLLIIPNLNSLARNKITSKGSSLLFNTFS